MASTTETASPADFSLAALDLRAAARRAALPLALAVAAGAALLLAHGPVHVLADAVDRAVSADPRWIVVAAAAEALSFAGYVALFWLVGRRASPRLDLRTSGEITLSGAAATRLLPTAGAGGAALTLWALARTGLGSRQAGRLLLTFFILLYSVFLAGIALSGAAIVLGLGGATHHTALAAGAALLAALAIVAALALGAAAPPEGTGRVARAGVLVGDAVRDGIAHLRTGDARLVGAVAWWAFDAAVLWCTFQALGTPPPVAVLVFAYFAGQAGNTIPLPGAVAGGMVGALLALGVAPGLALSSVLAYRGLAAWLPAPFGLVALGSLRARVARWARDDEALGGPTPAAPDEAHVSGRLALPLGAAPCIQPCG